MTSNSTGTYPPALHPGSTIALLSPSSRLNTIFPLRISRSITALTRLEFKVKEIYAPLPSPCTHVQQIQHRVSELHSAFLDPSIDGIICTIGGLSANELLPFIDWEIIRNNPKVFCGYSDITLLHLAIFAKTGLRTFYGPAAITQFAENPEPLSFTSNHFKHVLCPSVKGEKVGFMPKSETWTDEFGDWGNEQAILEKEGILKPRKMEKNEGWKWLRSGKCEGRMIGGCLPSLLQLAGTKYWPDFKDKVLLLENPEGERIDGPLPLEQTRSLMVDLMNLGVWDSIVGVVVGRPTGYEGEEVREYEDMVKGVCEMREEWSFTILSGVDVGHTDPIVTVPLNAVVKLDSEEGVWQILEPGVV